MTAQTSDASPQPVVGLPCPGRCLIMGILNVTPDSFSDGGRYFRVNDAVRHGLKLARDGADIVDVGGESTRPGSQRTAESQELQRILPVVSALTQLGVPVTIDTMRSRTAAAAVAVGAAGVNDVSGGLADPQMAGFIADARVPYVLVHRRPVGAAVADPVGYTDVVGELRERLDLFNRAGADLDRIIIDPGLGFAKPAEHNWQLLNRLPELFGLGRPVLIGASRKSFLRKLISSKSESVTLGELDTATAALSALVAGAGVYCVRVHDVRSSVVAVRMSEAWMGTGVAGTGEC